MRQYFFDKAGDQWMEEHNLGNWAALMNIIENAAPKKDPKGRPALPNKAWDILDIGCHTGGLLKLLNEQWRWRGCVGKLAGVEPLWYAQENAKMFLQKGVRLYGKIEEVHDQSADIIVSHETLYLVPCLREWMKELKRILRPNGGAFIALGSHGENTAWLRWRERLEMLYGHISYVYWPIQVLKAGVDAGFEVVELHRLHPEPQTSSMRFCPPKNGWGEFVSAEEALGFSRQKYVFVFYPKR